MRPYFTKYIPVPGDIASNDDFLYNGKVYNCCGTDDGWVWYESGLNPEADHADPGECTRVKLFLCSKDIQIGDTGYSEPMNRANQKVPEAYIDPYIEITVDNLEIFQKVGMYKIIGEVSPGAVWVTEGMEFDEDQIQLSLFIALAGEFTYKLSQLAGWSARAADGRCVKFLCSNCKTFH